MRMPSGATVRRVGRGLAEIESALLVPRFVPPSRSISEQGWRPDRPTAYCSRCGAGVGPGEQTDAELSREGGCRLCRGRVLAWDGVVRLGAYDGLLAEWVRELKFRRMAPVGAVLGKALAAQLALASEGPPLGRLFSGRAMPPPVVVPIPGPRLRVLSRGIDHTRAIAGPLAARAGWRCCRCLRSKYHTPQHRLAAEDRRRNIAGAFALRSAARRVVAGRGVVLVDDVLTTGATMRAASLALTGRRDLRSAPLPGHAAWVVACVAAVAGEVDS